MTDYKLNSQIINPLPADSTLINSPYLTNRILEVNTVYDSKIETDYNTVLTVKAGAKLAYPNGFEQDGTTPHFDTLTVPNDMSWPISSMSNGTYLLFPSFDFVVNYRLIANCHSGTSDTGSGTTFYDTTLNTLTSHNIGGDVRVTLPVAEVTITSNVITDLKIFTHTAYIGNSMFLLPLKCIYSIGKRVDGTYKNVVYNVDKVYVKTLATSANGNFDIGFDIPSSSNYSLYDENTLQDPDQYISYFGAYTYCLYTSNKVIYPSAGNVCWYNPTTGQTRSINSGGTISTTIYGSFRPARCTITNGKITTFWNQTDELNVNSYSRSQMSAISMPSDRYIDLTLGANNTKYTSIASGEVFLRMNGGGVNTGYVALYYIDENNALTAANQNYGTGDNGVSLRVTKGQRFGIGYASTATLKQFRFFYAEGEN